MSTQIILKNPSEPLRMKARLVDPAVILTPAFQRIIDDMVETMYEENGVGLAAPQIGQSIRLIVVDIDDEPQIFINPEITWKSLRKIDFEEGCLSVPGIFGIVRRHRQITFTAFNRKGEKIECKARGLMSVVVQHETDHLDGVLFIDRVIKFTNPPRM